MAGAAAVDSFLSDHLELAAIVVNQSKLILIDSELNARKRLSKVHEKIAA